jgi:pyruvate,water dikinase
MKVIIEPEEVQPADRPRIGGKGYALAVLAQQGFPIPDTILISTEAYHQYLQQSGLRERIQLELHRKDFVDMRWEEVWDCTARIRSLFLKKPLPDQLKQVLRDTLQRRFAQRPVAVRSSAPEEDDKRASFAGLHESFINIQGIDAILQHIRLVWASLWSDAALLYRQEIGLSIEHSAMAVVVQAAVSGECSGVAFTRNPTDESQAVVEAVHGFNQGLVDGTVEPDRWIIDRKSREVLSHRPVERSQWVTVQKRGVALAPIPNKLAGRPPLEPAQVAAVFALACRAEAFFGAPQDVEWTFQGSRLIALQSRPITTTSSVRTDDNRGWYLSLHRSLDNLKLLRTRIEKELIPEMIRCAEELTGVDLVTMTDDDLIAEVQRRQQLNQHWVNVYWSEFIPFAHGMRLFGQIYNQLMTPEDPYEFVDLLVHSDLASVDRNRQLADLAHQAASHPELAELLQTGHLEGLPADFRNKIDAFIDAYGDLSCTMTGGTHCADDLQPLVKVILQYASLGQHSPRDRLQEKRAERLDRFLDAYGDGNREKGLELLELARASYRLRDDDNIHLGRIEAQVLAALQETDRRIGETVGKPQITGRRKKLQAAIAGSNHLDKPADTVHDATNPSTFLQARQLTGQPAGPGVARGRARVIRQHTDLPDFMNGEILVCDVVDPNMTFVVPLAAAVVERRGGMLIHGAIIAREYGLPCVTGIPDATSLIQTGDTITVDGYLGIVTVHEKSH